MSPSASIAIQTEAVTGRDAADKSFATIFGAAQSSAPVILIEAHDDPAEGFYLPRFVAAGLSTHA